MDYFLLNINRDETNKVDYWISERQIAPIFYGNNTIHQILNNQSNLSTIQLRDAYLFANTFEQFNENALIVSIGEENVYFYKQDGKLQEYEKYTTGTAKDGFKEGIVKGFPIKIIKKFPIKNSPLILVTIKSNRYMSAGTFKKINSRPASKSYSGNIRAIEYIITGKIQEVKNFEEYLFCLSSLEFETLIAKLFEESGYFVPAYKGGFLKNYDLFCTKNDETISLQIKLEMEEKYYNTNTDYFYCIISNTVSTNNIKNWRNIEEEIACCPKTKEWLMKTLYWVKLNHVI